MVNIISNEESGERSLRIVNSLNSITNGFSIVLKNMGMKLLPLIDTLEIFYNITYRFPFATSSWKCHAFDSWCDDRIYCISYYWRAEIFQ